MLDDHDTELGHSSETGSVHGSCSICQMAASVLGPHVEAVFSGPLLSIHLEPSIIAHSFPLVDLEALSGRGPPPFG